MDQALKIQFISVWQQQSCRLNSEQLSPGQQWVRVVGYEISPLREIRATLIRQDLQFIESDFQIKIRFVLHECIHVYFLPRYCNYHS